MKKRLFFFGFLTMFSLLACTSKQSEAPSPPARRFLNLAIWGNYIAPEQAESFLKKTGIELRMSNYSSNEELLAKIQSGASGFDVAVPSDYMVEILTKMQKLEKIDRKQLTNFKELSPEFLKQSFDPENDFSIPYAWSITGIAIQRDLYNGVIKSWKDLFTNTELNGKISLLDDARETMGAALKKNGFSYNSLKDSEVETAKKDLLSLRSRIKMFRSDMVDALVNKEVAVGQAYSTDAHQAWKKTNGRVEFVIPSEGSTMAIDNLVILKGSPHVAEALELINYFLEPEVNAQLVEKTLTGPVLKKTEGLLSAELRKNRGFFPNAKILSQMEKIRDLGDKTRSYDEAWTEIKSH